MTTSAPKPIRSPSYPNIPLSEAIASVRKIEAAYRRSPVDREVGAKLIGYSTLSGPANKALAALAQYGLVERAGKGEMRVTALAQAILHPDSEEEKRKSLREAAFGTSGLFQELQDRWQNMVPPEEGVITYLNRQGFNQSAIKPAARAYLQTLTFLNEAGAGDSRGVETPEEQGAPAQTENATGSRNEVERPLSLLPERSWTQENSFGTSPPPPAIKQEVGETEWMRISLSSTTKVRLLSHGEIGPREIGKLIKLLEAQRAILLDELDED